MTWWKGEKLLTFLTVVKSKNALDDVYLVMTIEI